MYDVKDSAKTIAKYLDKVLIDLIGYRAVSLAPYASGTGLLTPRLDVQVDVSALQAKGGG